MEVTAVNAEDGKLVAERPILQDSAIVDVGYVGEPGIIIGRLNAFDVDESGDGTRRGRRRRGRALGVVDAGRGCVSAASSAARTSTSRTPTILVGGGRGLGEEENFKLAEDLAESLGRRRRRDPRGRRRRLVPLRGPDRPDRQDGRAEALPRGRHLRRDPAQGRDAELREHPRRSTRTRTRRSSSSATSAWSATCTRSSRS